MFNIPKGTNIVICEGIAGAGKNTVQKNIRDIIPGGLFYEFGEEELLFSWRHMHIPEIDLLRLSLYENFLEYAEKIIRSNADAVFLLNRFHISYTVFTKLHDSDSELRLTNILTKLKKLKAFVVVPIVKEEDIELRSLHIERTDPLWRQYLEEKMIRKEYLSLQDMYSTEQQEIIQILKKQDIPYVLTEVNVN